MIHAPGSRAHNVSPRKCCTRCGKLWEATTAGIWRIRSRRPGRNRAASTDWGRDVHPRMKISPRSSTPWSSFNKVLTSREDTPASSSEDRSSATPIPEEGGGIQKPLSGRQHTTPQQEGGTPRLGAMVSRSSRKRMHGA